MKSLIFLIVFNVMFIKVYAQKDYVITLKNDTIRGTIKMDNYGSYVLKKVNKGESIDINTQNYSQFYIDKEKGKYYAKTYSDWANPEFLEKIEEGRIEVFEKKVIKDNSTPPATSLSPTGQVFGRGIYIKPKYTKEIIIKTWYLFKKDAEVLKLKEKGKLNGKQRELFHTLISDYNELADRFLSEKDYSVRQAMMLLRIYNFDMK